LSRFNVDDVIQAKVINVSREVTRRSGSPSRDWRRPKREEIYKTYLDGRNGATSNLGEILKKEMLGRDTRELHGR
jgi:hypothetical protein